MIAAAYKKRPVRFLEIYQHEDWRIKIYSISFSNEFVDTHSVAYAKENLAEWLLNKNNYSFDNYKIAVLILHEYRDGCFAIIGWWTDENMLQMHVYLAANEKPGEFKLFSDKGIVTCVWEMAVWWFERNAWIENVLMKAPKPDYEKYLLQQMNEDV
jgi:hypothetical protein